jgi:hypothetical protein
MTIIAWTIIISNRGQVNERMSQKNMITRSGLKSSRWEEREPGTFEYGLNAIVT